MSHFTLRCYQFLKLPKYANFQGERSKKVKFLKLFILLSFIIYILFCYTVEAC